MKAGINKRINTSWIFSVLTILTGSILLAYMIVVEDEPGALPLLLLTIGTAWFIINQVLIKKAGSNKKYEK